jgi:hypothetical protein
LTPKSFTIVDNMMGSASKKSLRLDARKLAIYEQAYKLALASLRGYGWRPDDLPRTEEIRTALATSIREKVAAGETDPKRIGKLALENVFLGERLGRR